MFCTLWFLTSCFPPVFFCFFSTIYLLFWMFLHLSLFFLSGLFFFVSFFVFPLCHHSSFHPKNLFVSCLFWRFSILFGFFRHFFKDKFLFFIILVFLNFRYFFLKNKNCVNFNYLPHSYPYFFSFIFSPPSDSLHVSSPWMYPPDVDSFCVYSTHVVSPFFLAENFFSKNTLSFHIFQDIRVSVRLLHHFLCSSLNLLQFFFSFLFLGFLPFFSILFFRKFFSEQKHPFSGVTKSCFSEFLFGFWKKSKIVLNVSKKRFVFYFCLFSKTSFSSFETKAKQNTKKSRSLFCQCVQFSKESPLKKAFFVLDSEHQIDYTKKKGVVLQKERS